MRAQDAQEDPKSGAGKLQFHKALGTLFGPVLQGQLLEITPLDLGPALGDGFTRRRAFRRFTLAQRSGSDVPPDSKPGIWPGSPSVLGV